MKINKFYYATSWEIKKPITVEITEYSDLSYRIYFEPLNAVGKGQFFEQARELLEWAIIHNLSELNDVGDENLSYKQQEEKRFVNQSIRMRKNHYD